MLFQIGSSPSAPDAPSLAVQLRHDATSDALVLLLGCHARIRHFTGLAAKLARLDTPISLVPEAAASVHRYYTQALPLHEADENESVYPRLEAALRAAVVEQPKLAAANQAMVDQHRVLNQLICQLVPQWFELQAHPGGASATAGLAAQLQQAWEQHLEMEESVIFPALERFLSLEDRAAIRQEMVERRNLRSPEPAELTQRPT